MTYHDLMNGTFVSTVINTPLEPNDPRLAAAKLQPAGVEKRRPIEVTGPSATVSEWLGTPLPEPTLHTYESEVAALRRKYGYDDEPGENSKPVSGDHQTETDDGPYRSLLIGPTLTPTDRRRAVGPAVNG
jgi:hypothetical protein